MPFFKPAKIFLDCVSLQVSQSALRENCKTKRKRVYLFTSKGSISIEASIAIYMFIMVILFMESYLMFLNTEFSMQTKINNVAIEAAKNMFYVESLDEATDKNNRAKEVKKKILEIIDSNENAIVYEGIGKGYLSARLIQEIELKNTKFFLCGVAGINTTESSFENGIVDLVATYKIEVPFINKYITLTQRGKMKAWQGTDLTKNQKMVYITKTGKVYHATKDCTYLSIKIKKTIYGEIKKDYEKCNICINYEPNLAEAVYVTEDGEKYHLTLKCRGLVRNIIIVSKEEVKDMSECSKCGKGES